MNELLMNIDSLIKNHFRYKLKDVIWRDEDTEEFVNNKADEVTDAVYEYIYDLLHEAEKEIDDEIQVMEEAWEENPLSHKDFNVFMLRRKRK